MKILNNNDLSFVNKQFSKFSTQTLSTPKSQNERVVLSGLQKFERMYKRLGVSEMFMLKAQEFAENCNKQGLIDFTGIIYAFLIKMPNLPFELQELLIKRALEIAKKQNDDIHVLARIVDLKKLYRKNHKVPKKVYLNTLNTETQVLKKIVRNYDESAKNFKTISRGLATQEEYKYRLAQNYVDVAKAIFSTNKRTAGEKLLEARKIFKDLGYEKDLFLVEGLLVQLNR